MRSILACGVLVVLACSPALADKLPKNATPLGSDEIEKIYSGRTAVWKVSSVYFAADHTDKGVFKKKYPFKGTWSVKDNEACMVNGDAPKQVTDCWKWWRSGKKLVTLWSTHFDGSKVDEKNGYYSGEEKNFKDGDLVSATYTKAGGT